jgi:hypothetical protein
VRPVGATCASVSDRVSRVGAAQGSTRIVVDSGAGALSPAVICAPSTTGMVDHGPCSPGTSRRSPSTRRNGELTGVAHSLERGTLARRWRSPPRATRPGKRSATSCQGTDVEPWERAGPRQAACARWRVEHILGSFRWLPQSSSRRSPDRERLLRRRRHELSRRPVWLRPCTSCGGDRNPRHLHAPSSRAWPRRALHVLKAYPPAAQIIRPIVMSAIFLDQFDGDRLAGLERHQPRSSCARDASGPSAAGPATGGAPDCCAPRVTIGRLANDGEYEARAARHLSGYPHTRSGHAAHALERPHQPS